MSDWLTAFDDALVRRYLNCILCGQAADGTELHTSGDCAVAIGVCYKCIRADVSDARRQAVVAQLITRQQPP